VEAALELVDTVDELHAAISDPRGFLERVIQGAGPVAMRIAIEQLRPLLEPRLPQLSLEWADVATALELVDTVQELRDALSDPEGFLTRAMDGVGPVAKRLVIGKLKPLLLPHLPKLSLQWEDVEAAVELLDTLEEIRAAASDPQSFLQRVAESAVHENAPAGKTRAAASNPSAFLTRVKRGTEASAVRAVAQVNQWEHECFDADEATGTLTGANPRDIWASLQSMRGEADVALHGEEISVDEFQRLFNVLFSGMKIDLGDKLIALIDEDNSLTISEDEFVKQWSKLIELFVDKQVEAKGISKVQIAAAVLTVVIVLVLLICFVIFAGQAWGEPDVFRAVVSSSFIAGSAKATTDSRQQSAAEGGDVDALADDAIKAEEEESSQQE